MDAKDCSDYELIRLVIDGEQYYFGELVTRYKNLIYSVVLRMVNDREEANDLAQDVFVKIYRNLDKYYPDFKFSTWIMRIATNHVIDYRRKKKYETVSMDSVDFEMAAKDSPEEEYLEKEQKLLLQRAVGALPEMYRVPIVLFHQQGLSYQEISEIIGEPLSKVKNRIFRGRKMLKDALTMNGREGNGYGLQEG